MSKWRIFTTDFVIKLSGHCFIIFHRPERAYSLKVGVGRSNAKSYLRTPAEVIALIQEFVSIASHLILLVAGFCLD